MMEDLVLLASFALSKYRCTYIEGSKSLLVCHFGLWMNVCLLTLSPCRTANVCVQENDAGEIDPQELCNASSYSTNNPPLTPLFTPSLVLTCGTSWPLAGGDPAGWRCG